MKRLFAGIIVVVVLVIAAVLVWYELEDQARGIVVGVLLGTGGVVVGILVALATVAIFLLIQLRWSVNQGKPSILLPDSRPALPPPAQAQPWYAPRRAPRQWADILGGEDAEGFSSEKPKSRRITGRAGPPGR